MLSYIKTYRKLRGGKWYKCAKYSNIFGTIFYYSKTKPTNYKHWIVKKYKY